MGSVGLDWLLGGFAVDPPTGAMGNSTSQLVLAMAGFGGGGAADGVDAGAMGADSSQPPFLAASQQV